MLQSNVHILYSVNYCTSAIVAALLYNLYWNNVGDATKVLNIFNQFTLPDSKCGWIDQWNILNGRNNTNQNAYMFQLIWWNYPEIIQLLLLLLLVVLVYISWSVCIELCCLQRLPHFTANLLACQYAIVQCFGIIWFNFCTHDMAKQVCVQRLHRKKKEEQEKASACAQKFNTKPKT